MTLFTVGHGTADVPTFLARLQRAEIRRIVDVRRFPLSRRMPWFNGAEMEAWLRDAGIAYRHDPALGGRRAPAADSANVALRERGFRGYADHMQTGAFQSAFGELMREVPSEPTAVLCAETLWWRCHRRLIADAAVLLEGIDVAHVIAEKVQPHILTAGVRRVETRLVYDGAAPP